MATTRHRVHSAWVPPPEAERAGPTPFQLVWTLAMVVFMAAVVIKILINS